MTLVFGIGDGKCAHRCWEFCSNPCACKTAAAGNCEYMPISGSCTARGSCSETTFGDNECRRRNSYYSVGGVLCYHNKNERNCEGGRTVYAANIGGDEHLDQRGIAYTTGRGVIYEDDHVTMRENSTALDAIDDVDKDLYGSYAFGRSKGAQVGQCLHYLAQVLENGWYELAIRTVEPNYEKTGQRVCKDHLKMCILFVSMLVYIYIYIYVWMCISVRVLSPALPLKIRFLYFF